MTATRIIVALVLLVGAGLMIRSFLKTLFALCRKSSFAATCAAATSRSISRRGSSRTGRRGSWRLAASCLEIWWSGHLMIWLFEEPIQSFNLQIQ